MRKPICQSGKIRGSIGQHSRLLKRLWGFIALALLASSSALGQTPPTALSSQPASAQQTRLTDSVIALTQRVTALGGKLGLSIVEVQSGNTLAEVNARLALNPASNMKLLTAAVLLDQLGPNYQFSTGLYGTRLGSEVRVLVLRGRGDPSLRTTDLLRLAVALQKSGVTKVGEILVDQGYFDSQYVPPGFDAQPNEWAPFRAPVSAVALEGNTVTLNVLPSAPGSNAHIWFEPEGLVRVAGEVLTKPPGSGQKIGWTLHPQAPGLVAELGGTIASDLPRQRFKKRLHDPRIMSGLALGRMLRDLGVQVGDRVSEGGSDIKDQLVYHESLPLAALLQKMGKDSDNFYAEMLLKVLGAQSTGLPGTSAAGSQAILTWLAQHQALVPGTRITNASGLYDTNRISAWTLSQTLRNAFLSSRLQPEYLAHLAIAGVDGTLRSRMTSLAKARSLRAKTGTLDSTVALSGYALRGAPSGTVAFSMIVDGVAGHHAELRQLFDAIAVLLAGPQ